MASDDNLGTVLADVASRPPADVGKRLSAKPAEWDCHAMLLLFCVFSFLYAYFFQGGGWNQNSHFDTVRSIVERHTMDITPLAGNTGDVGFFGDRVFSARAPGLALCGAPFYFILYHWERYLGLDPGSFWTATVNAHVLTFFASGLPGVLLLLVLYRFFRREQATVTESLCLTGAFGTGSLLFPYSGVLMSHVLTACLLFVAWYIVSAFPARRKTLFFAGLLAGLAAITDLLATPAAVLFLFYAARKRSGGELLAFLGGSALMAGTLLLHNYLCFENILTTNLAVESNVFKNQGFLFGVLQWPQPIRLFFLTVHPFRGLFYCCPVLLIPFLSLQWPARIREIRLECWIPLLLIAYFVLFDLSFNGWTGGWVVGPRYLIAITPFLFSFALRGFRRFPIFSRLLIVVSAVSMLCVTAVQVMDGPPPPLNPIAFCIRQLVHGRVSISTQGMLDYLPVHSMNEEWDSYNLGEVLGLRGLTSLLPVVLAVIAFAASAGAFERAKD